MEKRVTQRRGRVKGRGGGSSKVLKFESSKVEMRSEAIAMRISNIQQGMTNVQVECASGQCFGDVLAKAQETQRLCYVFFNRIFLFGVHTEAVGDRNFDVVASILKKIIILIL